MTDTVLVNIDSRGVARLTLNRPEVHNAFDDVLILKLIEKLKDLDSNDDVRVVILAANGKSFSAGGDLGWMQRTSDYSFNENLADARDLADLMKILNRLSNRRWPLFKARPTVVVLA